PVSSLKYSYTHVANTAKDWTLVTTDLIANRTLRTEEETWTNDQRDYVLKNEDNTIALHVRDQRPVLTFENNSTSGTYLDQRSVLTQRIIDPDGAQLTTTRTFVMTGSGAGQLQSIVRPDGDWLLLGYNYRNYLAQEIRPLKNTPFDPVNYDNGVRITSYS